MSREFLIHNGRLTSDLDADGNLIKNLPGVAHLVDGKVPSDELPSYVDDVLEYATRSSFPATGERGKIYIALDTNKTYRWSGTQYTEIASPTLDDTVTKDSANGVKSSGIWSAIWGALASLPTGFTSLYDWCRNTIADAGNRANAAIAKADNALLAAATADTKAVTALTDIATHANNTTIHVTAADKTAWNGKQDALTAQQLDNIAAVPNKANRAANPTADHLASLDASGNLTDSQIPAANVALKGNIPYNLGTPIVIDTADAEPVDGIPVWYGAATIADRTANIVQATAATALDELRITFPAATGGKVRDFGLRVEIGTGSAALTAPALVPIAPTGETIKLENADGTIPELADGTATAKGVTLLYFSETASGTFVVKGEQVEEVA